MIEKYKILGNYIRDLSSETPDLETYLYVKDYIKKYQLNIEIASKALKDKIIEISTIFKFDDKTDSKKKSFFEIVFITIIRINDEIKDKKELEKIILCDVQIEIYPNLEKTFLNLIHNSGYPDLVLEKKIDFKQLYESRAN